MDYVLYVLYGLDSFTHSDNILPHFTYGPLWRARLLHLRTADVILYWSGPPYEWTPSIRELLSAGYQFIPASNDT